MRRKLLIAAGALAIAGAAFISIQGDDKVSLPSIVDSAFAQEAQDPKIAAAMTPEVEAELKAKGYAVGDVALGKADAPVTIIEYVRTTCPACKAFHETSLQEIKKRYIDTGVAKLILREVYVDLRGLSAAALARCNGPENYHAFNDILLKRQSEWSNVNNVNDLRSKLAAIGKLGGLSTEQMNKCLDDTQLLEYLLARAITTTTKDQIRATPTIFIQGERFNGRFTELDKISALIEAAATKAQ